MNQLEYVPGIGGASVQMDGPSSFVGIAENLRSREWEYDLGYRDLVSATRPAREVDVTFNADYATADDLRRVADADVTARTPGVFVAQKEWRQRGYILASQPNDIHYGRLSTELKITLLDGAWWRLVDKTFMPENTAPTYRSATGKLVTTGGAANVPLHALTVDGESVQDGTPTPDEPVDVQVVEGRNLLENKATSQTTNGVTFTVNPDGTISLAGTATANTALILCQQGVSGIDLSNLKGKTVTLSGGVSSAIRILFYADSAPAFGDSGNGVTFTVNDVVNTGLTATTTRCYVYINSGAVCNNVEIKPQLEIGTTATHYTPYGSIGLKVGSTITPINLNGNVLASLPDGTRDTVTVDGAGHCVLSKRVGMVVFDGGSDENWSLWNSGARVMTTAISSLVKPASGNSVALATLSNHFASISANQTAIGTVVGVSVSNDAKLFFANGTGTMTVDAWKTWLASNNVTLYYPLLTSQTLDLGYIDMPNVFDGAVVSITAEVTPTITAEWQTSPDIYLDYPHNYPYDYQKTSSTESIMPSVLTPSDVRLVIYGPAVNPYVIVGGNRYQVNVTVPAGGYLTVDGRDKSINLTLADGTVQNVFSSGVRGGGAGGGSYIFEQIPAGTSEVTFDGSFGFDLGWYEEEGEPPWSQF